MFNFVIYNSNENVSLQSSSGDRRGSSSSNNNANQAKSSKKKLDANASTVSTDDIYLIYDEIHSPFLLLMHIKGAEMEQRHVTTTQHKYQRKNR